MIQREAQLHPDVSLNIFWLLVSSCIVDDDDDGGSNDVGRLPRQEGVFGSFPSALRWHQ